MSSPAPGPVAADTVATAARWVLATNQPILVLDDEYRELPLIRVADLDRLARAGRVRSIVVRDPTSVGGTERLRQWLAAHTEPPVPASGASSLYLRQYHSPNLP